MKNLLIIILILIPIGCSTTGIENKSAQGNSSTIKEYYNDGSIKSEFYFKGDYTEWYPNKQIKFRASDRTGINEIFPWHLPTERIVRDKHFSLVFKYSENWAKKIKWGEYYRYEGWHYNGQKMFIYDLENRTYIEWDSQGTIIKRGK